MPITFGSVGDIISVSLLVKDIVESLDESRGSVSEYQSLIRELWILDRALLEVEKLFRKHQNKAELVALYETAKKVLDACQTSVEGFKGKLKKYDRCLREGSSACALFRAGRKIQWKTGCEEEVERFKVEVRGHSYSLNMLLNVANADLITLSDEKLNDRITDSQNITTVLLTKQDAVLAEIDKKLEENHRLIGEGNFTASRVLERLRLDWVRDMGTQLTSLLKKVLFVNILTYRTVLSLQKSMPIRSEQLLIQEPFILEDAIGRIIPVHLQFVTSWEMLEIALELRFQGLRGLGKIKRREYVLQEKRTQRDIARRATFEGTFLPGQRVDMSLIFQTQAARSGERSDQLDEACCPGCDLISVGSEKERDIECIGCGMSYRHIIKEDSQPTSLAVPAPPFKGTHNDETRSEIRSKRKPRADEDTDCPRDFKRVRLISHRTTLEETSFCEKLNNVCGNPRNPIPYPDPIHSAEGHHGVVSDERDSISAADKEEDVVSSDSTQMLNCHKIWDMLSAQPDFKNGTIDIDALCTEVRGAARCSENGVVIAHADVEAAIEKVSRLGRSQSPSRLDPNAHPYLTATYHALPQITMSKIERTTTDAALDELYNPSLLAQTAQPTSQTKPNASLLSPYHNVIRERLQAAQNARSQSPASSISRGLWPFRKGSPFAGASHHLNQPVPQDPHYSSSISEDLKKYESHGQGEQNEENRAPRRKLDSFPVRVFGGQFSEEPEQRHTHPPSGIHLY